MLLHSVSIVFNVQNATSLTYVVKNKNGFVVVSNTSVSGNSIVLSNLAADDYVITIANSGSGNYNGYVCSADFHVDKAGSSVSVPQTSVVYVMVLLLRLLLL